MKKVKLSTKKILEAYNVIGSCKYGKMDSDDKIRVWKLTCALKPIAEKYDEQVKDASEKMKPGNGFDELRDKVNVFQQMTRSTNFDATKLPMGPSEFMEALKEIREYGKLVDKSLKDFSDKEETVEFEPITSEAFLKLMDSNPDIVMAQFASLDWIVKTEK